MKKDEVTTEIIVKENKVGILRIGNVNYISLTDLTRIKNSKEPKDVVKNWMRTRSTLEFLGLWEKMNNPEFRGPISNPYYQKLVKIYLQCHLQDGLVSLMQ